MATRITDWDNFIGHKDTIKYIKRQIETDTVQDVVLFEGNAGIGKSSMAMLLAIDVVTKGKDASLRAEYVQSVIMKKQSTDSIKLFSMATIEDKEEEILKVKTGMHQTFSNTGRTVLILDEAQGMSQRAQSSILIELEHLPKGVYIFLCTTESGVFTDAFSSRIKSTFHLSDLSSSEIRLLLKREIEARRLIFDVRQELVIATISTWANKQPRKALNLLENFDAGSHVTAKDIEVFINTNSGAAMVELLKYLYGSMALGLDYLDSLKYDSMFPLMVIELCKVAIGQNSDMFSSADVTYIHEFMVGKDVDNIICFTANVAGLRNVTKRFVISEFMRAHVSYKKEPPVNQVTAEMHMSELRTIAENVGSDVSVIRAEGTPTVQSLEMLLAQAESVD